MAKEREVAVTEGGDGASPDLGFRHRNRNLNLVLWDLELCPLPMDLDMEETDILPAIRHRLSEWGYSGRVQMLAVGRPISLPENKLAYAGIFITHVSDGKGSNGGLLGALSSWIKNKPSPANVLLIVGDRRFDSDVESLRKDNYNVLQRQQECMCFGIESHADYCWSWPEVFDGGRPQGNLKRLQGNDGPSFSGEPMEGRSGPDVSPPCKFAPS